MTPAAASRRDGVDADCAGRHTVRARGGLRGPSLAERVWDTREPHAWQNGRRRDGHQAGRDVSLSGRARTARAIPHDRGGRLVEAGRRTDRAGAPHEARRIAGRRHAVDARRPAAARLGRRRSRPRRPRRLVCVPRFLWPARARPAGDGVTRAVRRGRGRAAGQGLRLRRREDPRRPPRADDRLRLPGPVRRGAARPAARARLRGSVSEDRARLGRAAGRLRLPEGAAARADGSADAAFWRRLARPAEIVPRHRFPSSHIEIDKARQILMVVRDGRAVLVSPVSTGGGYCTPEGRFAIIRKIPGYDPSPLGVLYKPMYFYGGYAIHGNPSVPPYPASHGCVRVPNFVADPSTTAVRRGRHRLLALSVPTPSPVRRNSDCALSPLCRGRWLLLTGRPLGGCHPGPLLATRPGFQRLPSPPGGRPPLGGGGARPRQRRTRPGSPCRGTS